MGLPEINIYFTQAADTAVARSGNGIVALILRDDTSSANTQASYSFMKMDDVVKSHFTAASLDYISKTFIGGPKRVLVERIGAEETYDDALGRLKNKKWNYLAIPGLADGEKEDIKGWIIDQRAAKKPFKAVLPNCLANDEGIIKFTTEDIRVGNRTYTSSEYCCRIAGLLAGLALDQYDRNSATYAVLPEVESITESTDPDGDIEDGKLILINDGAKFKLGRAVNSLVTLSNGKTEDMKKIRIVETMDLIREDIRTAFEENYIGLPNSYVNKLMFITAINQYFDGLERSHVLYDAYDNRSFIDIDGQRAWLAEKMNATDLSELSEQEIKEANTGSHVFAGANVQIQDAIEDLDMYIMM